MTASKPHWWPIPLLLWILWFLLWTGVGLVFGLTLDSHAAMAVPLYSGIFGAVAGLPYAGLYVWFARRRPVTPSFGACLGAVAALLAILFIGLLAEAPPDGSSVIFALVAGPSTGALAARLLVKRGQRAFSWEMSRLPRRF